MFVDDSRTTRNIQNNALEQLYHTDIVEAEDAVRALAVFAKEVPDLMPVDWKMPNWDGITLIRAI